MFANALQKRRVIVVGYYNVDVKAGKYSMIALNIDPMNPEKSATLDELFPYNAKVAAKTSAGNSDQIRTWDSSAQSYRYFFMYYNAFVPADPKNHHWVEDISGTPLANVELKTGDAVFYYPKDNDNSFSIPGQVPSEACGSLVSGYNMIGVGFPAEWNPNDAGVDFWSGSDFKKAASAGNADEIRYWDDVNQIYRYFFLYTNLFLTSDPKNNKWVEDDASKTVLEESLKTGSGFFYIRKNSGTIPFKPGLKL